MLATMAPTLAAINPTNPPLRRAGTSVAASNWPGSVGARLALYQPPAALEQIRGVVRHFAALLIQLAALIERLATHVGDHFAPVLRLLAQIAPRILTGLRCVEQRDGSAERRPRQKPYQSV